jgi:hypothetical protein
MLCLFLLLGIQLYSQQVSFIARRDFGLGTGLTNPVFATVADMDGDKNLDVLVSSNQGLILMKGDGTGRLGPGVNLLPGALNAVVAGDFNNDGIMDLAVGKNVGVVILYGDGKGGYMQMLIPQSSVVLSLTVDDFNRDDFPDLLVTNSTASGAVTLFRGLESGEFDLANPERYPVGTAGNPTPRFVTSVDLNGDKYPDAVVANQTNVINTNDVTVLLWNPAQDQFDVATPYVTGLANSLPNFIATGDFNNDGHEDVVLANLQGQSISIFFGDGTGRIGPRPPDRPPTMVVGQNPYVVTEDFNSDGFVDIAVSNSTLNGVSIFDGNRQGVLGSPRNFAVGLGPRTLATGDFNGDDIVDLVVANFNSSSVTVLLGDGQGGFLTGEQRSGLGPAYMATGDLNGDSLPDLVVINRDANTISIYMASPGGGFNPPITIDPKRVGVGPLAVVIGDMDGDNKPDLVVAYLSTVKIFFGDGQGQFPRIQSIRGVGPGITALAVKDFNRDGKLDIAIASLSMTPNTVTVLLQNQMGEFDNQTNFRVQTQPRFIIAEDFNGDNYPDLAVANFGTNPGSVSILLNDQTGLFQDARNISLGTGAAQPISMVAGDFDADGKLDLAITNAASNNISILLGDGQGGFDVGTPPRRIITTTPSSITTADFNGDGIPDLAVVNRQLNATSVFLSDGQGGFMLGGSFGVGIQGTSGYITSLDINQDGLMDLLCVNYVGNSISLLINNTAIAP